jgi:phosphoglycolate phosphatase
MLLLFDIDATLLVTSRSGVYAMQDAGRELFGPAFSFGTVDFAGRLDPLILADLFRHNEIPPTPDNFAKMRRAYHAHMTRRLAVPNTARALPGVLDLIAALSARPDTTLALLTGNFAETGLLKIRSIGLDPATFPIQVWGDHSPHDPPQREHLVPVAFERYNHHARSSGERGAMMPPVGDVKPSNVLVIGDTPHDVACAKAHRCRSLAVATGLHSVATLQAAGADHVVPDLSDTAAILDVIFR